MAEQVQHEGLWWHRKDDGSIHRAEGDGWVRWSPGDPGPTPPPQFFGAPMADRFPSVDRTMTPPSALDAPKSQAGAKKFLLVGTLGLVAFLLYYCPQIGDDSSPSGSSGLACDHFRNVAGDIGDGVLTVEEVRSKLEEIDSNASIASPRVQSAARTLRATVTAFAVSPTAANDSAVADAITEMSDACLEEGS